MTDKRQKRLTQAEQTTLLKKLESRFAENMMRHPALEWEPVLEKLLNNPQALWSLNEMEKTGGEPDIVGQDAKTEVYLFFDCSAESPIGRRNVCYDRAGLDARKSFKPETSAVEMAIEMGIELLTEEQYFQLQSLGIFDLKSSSWLKTPPEMRKLGGALYGDRRYGRVFVYTNGASAYYRVRGFRLFYPFDERNLSGFQNNRTDVIKKVIIITVERIYPPNLFC